MDMDGIFGAIILGCGVYCLYGYYMIKFKNEINSTLLLSKDLNVNKCKDYRGYCKEAQRPLLLLGIVTTIQGGIDLYETFVGKTGVFYIIALAAFVVVLFVYAFWIKKINQKYF